MMAASFPPRVIFVVLVLITAITGQCPDWTTGPGCAYDCHCSTIGPCNNGYLCGTCAPGWRGPSCQQGNIAKGKTTIGTSYWSSNDPSNAVDGDITTYVHTSEAATAISAWWRVDLGGVTHVHEVVIYFRTTQVTRRRRGLEFYKSEIAIDGSTRPNNASACYIVQGSVDGSDISKDLSITECGGDFQYLMIYSDTSNEGSNAVVFDFLEVEVYGCSQRTFGNDCSQFCQQCDSAGCDVNGICHSGCPLTNQHGDNCQQTCDYCDSSGCFRSGVCREGCERSNRYGDSCENTCDYCDLNGCNKTGVCGVGCSDSQQYGEKCEYTCTTCDGSGCDKTGACNGGCAQLNQYGTNCSQACHYCDGSGCNTSGVCRIGCLQFNLFGASCDQICDNCDSNGCYSNGTCRTGCVYKQYGPTCADTCNRCDTSGCYRNGTCKGGCSETNSFGINCSEMCNDCDSSGCDMAGLCKEGCSLSNQYGEKCDQTCDNCDSSGCHMTGVCREGCAQLNQHGASCTETCDNCDASGCNKTGVCTDGCAQASLHGARCVDTCVSCDSHGCHRNGSCISGSSGYTGPGVYYVPIASGVVAGLVVLAVVAVVVIVCRWRRKRKTNKGIMQDEAVTHTAKTDNVYVNVSLEDEDAKESKTDGVCVAKPPVTTKKTPVNADMKKHGGKGGKKKATATETTSNMSESEKKASANEAATNQSQSADKDPYYNISTAPAIPIASLPDVIRAIKEQDGGFETEFNSLPTGFTAPYEDSQEPHNSGKNRFKGYYPYDHNRVRLSLIPDIPGSDYINASLMHSYNQRKKYIAAQAPKKTTVCDFWRMIWEHRCQLVVMLTGLVEDGKPKCVQYWPGEEQLDTELHNMHLELSDVRANYTVRHFKLTLKSTGECRSVAQYHYTSWPDHGVPDTLALVNFIWMIRRNTLNNKPLLVHCSAGIGRTGTYIAVDSLLDQAVDQAVVNVPGYVCVIRGQRKGMIQTKEQYECVFECLLEMTKFGDTSMDVENFTTSYSNRGMDSMVDRKTLREITQMVISENRPAEVPGQRMWVDGVKDFVVMTTPSWRNLCGYLQTVSPSPDQEKLLWKLVEENNVHDVIVISALGNKFYGEVGQTETYGSLLVFTENEADLNSDLQKVTLHLAVSDLSDTDDSRNVTVLKVRTAPTVEQLSDWLLDVSHLSQVTGAVTPAVVVHDESDRKLAVTLCLMGNIRCEIIEDNRVDVIKHVRSIMRSFPGVDFTQVDVGKLHEFAMRCTDLVSKDKMYANL